MQWSLWGAGTALIIALAPTRRSFQMSAELPRSWAPWHRIAPGPSRGRACRKHFRRPVAALPDAHRFAACGRPLARDVGCASARDRRALRVPHARNSCRRRRKHSGLPHGAGRSTRTRFARPAAGGASVTEGRALRPTRCGATCQRCRKHPCGARTGPPDAHAVRVTGRRRRPARRTGSALRRFSS